MEYTQNYALRKPGLNEYANVGDLNYNADKIDSQMKKNQDVDGEVYDPTSTSSNAYEAGDYVINPDDGLMYVCNGTTYGTWDATKWDHTTEFDEIQKAMASGGESELADLHDVDITNPTDGQALLYDPTSSKWHNSDLPDADVTKEASGNPIEFEDGADAPLVKCVTEIQGYQEGSGTPSPENVRPIVAYTEGEIEVMGRNLANWTMTSYADASPTELKKGTYTCSIDVPMVDQNWYISAKKSDNTYCTKEELGLTNFLSSATTGVYYGARSLAAFTFTIPEDDVTVKIGSPGGHGQKIMLERGSVEHDYEPYTSTTHTTTYPSAIYRGSEDVVNGEVTSEWAVVEFDSNTSWSYDSTYGMYFTNVVGKKAGNTNIVSSNYAVTESELVNVQDGECRGTVSFANLIYFKNSNIATVEDFKASMIGQTLAYELATSTTSSVTPTNLPIKSLSGYNHIESSTGDMEIEYFPQKEQPLIDLIPEASNMHEYSTAEHAVGTWIDGETIYERSIDLGSFSIGSGGTYIIEEATDIDLLIDYDGYVIESSIMYALPDPSIRIKMESNKDLIFSGTASWSVTSGYLTIRYTKTSSNNRSLAKSAPQEETKEEQVEELKEEPTKEVKEELEEIKEEETIDPETNEEEKR